MIDTISIMGRCQAASGRPLKIRKLPVNGCGCTPVATINRRTSTTTGTGRLRKCHEVELPVCRRSINPRSETGNPYLPYNEAAPFYGELWKLGSTSRGMFGHNGGLGKGSV